MQPDPPTPPIEWRLHLAAPIDAVFAALDTEVGRAMFWAEAAPEIEPGVIAFRFSNGQQLQSRVLGRRSPTHFSLLYFDDSPVRFDLAAAEDGGTELKLRAERVPAASWNETHAGWIVVLLTLKAAVDHGVDLRNPHAAKSWEAGYVDV